MKRVIKSSVFIPTDKDKIFSAEDVSNLFELIEEKTGCNISIELEQDGTHSIIIDNTKYPLS